MSRGLRLWLANVLLSLASALVLTLSGPTFAEFERTRDSVVYIGTGSVLQDSGSTL